MSVSLPKYRQKPRLGARINWAHPLARGLVSAWLLRDGRPVELKYQKPSSGFSATGAPGGMVCTAGNATYSQSPPGPLSGDITVVSSVVIPSFSSINGLIEIPGVSTGNRYYHWFSSTGKPTWTLPAVNDYVATSVSLSAGQQSYVCAAYTRGVNVRFDINLTSQTVTATDTPNDTSGTQLEIGSIINGAYFLNGTVSYVYVYSRCLALHESRWLNAEPYAFIRPLQIRRHYSVPSGATFNPAWAGSATQIVGVTNA